jgi:hypothetical protein
MPHLDDKRIIFGEVICGKSVGTSPSPLFFSHPIHLFPAPFFSQSTESRITRHPTTMYPLIPSQSWTRASSCLTTHPSHSLSLHLTVTRMKIILKTIYATDNTQRLCSRLRALSTSLYIAQSGRRRYATSMCTTTCRRILQTSSSLSTCHCCWQKVPRYLNVHHDAPKDLANEFIALHTPLPLAEGAVLPRCAPRRAGGSHRQFHRSPHTIAAGRRRCAISMCTTTCRRISQTSLSLSTCHCCCAALPRCYERTTRIVRQLFLGKLPLRASYEESTLN